MPDTAAFKTLSHLCDLSLDCDSPYTPSYEHAGILSSRIMEGLLNECVNNSENDGEMELRVC